MGHSAQFRPATCSGAPSSACRARLRMHPQGRFALCQALPAPEGRFSFPPFSWRHGDMSLTPVATTGSVVAMEDYPRTLRELESRFGTDRACRESLAQLRWPDGETCPACQATRGWWTGQGLWMYATCGQQMSVTAGTIFENTRTPLTVWFRSIWWVVSQKGEASALGPQRVLGLGSYRTAGRGSTRSGARWS